MTVVDAIKIKGSRSFGRIYIHTYVHVSIYSYVSYCRRSNGVDQIVCVCVSDLSMVAAIRCFPHCCPHREYRYCGAPISVSITPRMSLGNICAFAAFFPCNVSRLGIGVNVLKSFFLKDLRDRHNLKGTWLQGRPDDTETVCPTWTHMYKYRSYIPGSQVAASVIDGSS